MTDIPLIKLDLGCGPKPVDDSFTGADLFYGSGWVGTAKPGEVISIDLRRFPWPFPDECVAEVFSSHFICHQTGADWVKMVDELYRVMVPQAEATFIWPAWSSARAWQDPTFLDHIPLERWSYADATWRRQFGVDGPSYPSCDFGVVQFDWRGLHDQWNTRSDEAKKFAASHHLNFAADLSITIMKDPARAADVVDPKVARFGMQV